MNNENTAVRALKHWRTNLESAIALLADRELRAKADMLSAKESGLKYRMELAEIDAALSDMVTA